MKIVAGLGSLDSFDEYVEAGADEVFVGYMTFEWLEKYGILAPVNRREALMYPVQIASSTDMRLLARRCADTGIPASVAVNSTGYPPKLYPALVQMIRELNDIGFERFILADPALILRVRAEKLNIKIHLSGEFGEFSRPSLQMLGGELISRLIFHRKVSPAEMAACASEFAGREFEAFILNERCYYTGAMCNSMHADEFPPLCRVQGKIVGVNEGMAEIRENISPRDENALGAGGCGLCTLDELEKAGITHLKLVGRGNRPERMVRDIQALKKALNLHDRSQMRENLFPNGCPGSCYYSSQDDAPSQL